jgi:DNA-binding FadR family transcriptional regulator
MPIQTIENPRLYRQIADQLRTLISSGEFPPGSRLPAERELAKQMGVSRASIREALIALEVIGLVDVRVGNGVLVCANDQRSHDDAPVMELAARGQWVGPDPELDIAVDFNAEIPPFSLLQARQHIEPETAALAALNANDEELAGIRAAYERNVRDNREGSTTHPGDRLFHIRIAQASGNPAYALMIQHLLGHRYGSMFQLLQARYTPDDMVHRSEHEHLRILEALEARASEAARVAMRAHLDEVIRIFSRGQELE